MGEKGRKAISLLFLPEHMPWSTAAGHDLEAAKTVETALGKELTAAAGHVAAKLVGRLVPLSSSSLDPRLPLRSPSASSRHGARQPDLRDHQNPRRRR